MVARHCYQFAGADDLVSLGASWFVSYAYYLWVDNTHKNWETSKSRRMRISLYNSTTHLHDIWLEEVVCMSDRKLSANRIGLNGALIKHMAKKIIEKKK